MNQTKMKRRTFLKTALAAIVGSPLALKDRGFWITIAGTRLKLRYVTKCFNPPLELKAGTKYYIALCKGGLNEISMG